MSRSRILWSALCVVAVAAMFAGGQTTTPPTVTDVANALNNAATQSLAWSAAQFKALADQVGQLATSLANTQSAVTTLQTQLGATQSDLTTLQNTVGTVASQSAQATAGFAAVQKLFAESPCIIYNVAFTPSSTGQKTVSFQTQKDCAAWIVVGDATVVMSGTVRNGCNNNLGTVPALFDATLKQTFSFALPTNGHCITIKTWDAQAQQGAKAYVY